MSSTTHDGWHDTCGHCGADLPLMAPSYQKYCSSACRAAAWEETLIGTRAAHNAARRQARLDAKRDRPPCLECGAPIPPEASLLRKYCSGRCEQRNYSRRAYARWREERDTARMQARLAIRAARSRRDAAE